MSILDYLDNCVVVSTVTQEEDEAQWVKNRMLGIGGSDVGSICGVNNYSSARLIYLIKTGQHEVEFSDASKERMYWGHVLEPIVADEFARRTKKKIAISPATVAHKDYPWALANIDRFIVDDEGKPIGILECKTADNRLNQLWAEGDVPKAYIYQLSWYLWVTGLKYGAFAALVGGNKFHYHEVYLSEELINSEIFPKCDKFWNYHVKQLIQPELSGTDADSDFVKEQSPEAVKNAEITLVDDEMDELAETIVAGKAQIKELEKVVKEAENRIKDVMKDHEIGYTADRIIKWSQRKQVRVDTDKLKTEYPEIFGKCNKTISYRVFTVK